MRLSLATMTSPIGDLTIAARENRLCLLHFGADGPDVRRMLQRWYRDVPIETRDDPAGAVTALASYFSGNLSALDRIGVELNGTTFQRRVWDALRRVRAGTTCSYADLARRINAAAAVRAVGAANGANPVALVVPCHRVIGTNGSLTGYGGGLERKRWLLQHEGSLPRLLDLQPARLLRGRTLA
jgi:methylated-DNA-[protein]-cysteine S-methyltransferase